MANVLARGEAKGLVDEAQSEAFLAMLTRMAIRTDDASLARALTDALHLARRYGLSSYDASCLELARAARKAGVERFTAR